MLKYNVGRFNVRQEAYAREIEFSIDGHEEILAVVGAGADREFSLIANGTINNVTSLNIVIPFELVGGDEIYSHVDMISTLPVLINGDCTINANIHASKIMNLDIPWDTTIELSLYVGKEMPLDLSWHDDINIDLYVGKEMPTEIDGWGIIDMFMTGGILYTTTTIIDVTIPPGMEIQIDSDIFTAWLRDDNIIHLYNGEWIMLNRQIVSIDLDSATGGNLEGEMIYNERFI